MKCIDFNSTGRAASIPSLAVCTTEFYKELLSTKFFLDIHNETSTCRTSSRRPPQILTSKYSIHSQYPHSLMGRCVIRLSFSNFLSNIRSTAWYYNMERFRCHWYIFIFCDLLPRGQCFLSYIRLSLPKGTTSAWTNCTLNSTITLGCFSMSCIRLFWHNCPHRWVVYSLDILWIFL